MVRLHLLCRTALYELYPLIITALLLGALMVQKVIFIHSDNLTAIDIKKIRQLAITRYHEILPTPDLSHISALLHNPHSSHSW